MNSEQLFQAFIARQMSAGIAVEKAVLQDSSALHVQTLSHE